MPDVTLLLCPEMHGERFSNRFNPSLSLAYLEPPFCQAGLSVECLDPFNDPELHQQGIEGIIGRIRAGNPTAVGISAVGNVWDSLLTVTARIKAATKKPIVVGGYISTLPEIMEMTDAIDVLFLGEGEARGPDVFKALAYNDTQREDALSKIPGLLYRTQAGEIRRTGPTPFIEEIDPFQPTLERTVKGDIAYLYASRGCYARCTFCDIRDQIGFGVRRMSGGKLSEVIEELATRFGIKEIGFYDDDFLHATGEPGRIDEIAPTLRKYGVVIDFQTRATDVMRRREEISRNRDCISHVSVGAESFVREQLRRWNKSVTPEQNMRAFEILSSLGVPYRALLIMVDGETTPEEIQTNIEHVLRLPPSGGVPYTVNAFSSSYIHGNPLKDGWGRDNLQTEGQRRFAKLMRESSVLGMRKEWLRSFDAGAVGDSKREELIGKVMASYRSVAQLASQALFVSAAEAMYEGERGERAAARHRELGQSMWYLLKRTPLLEGADLEQLDLSIPSYVENLRYTMGLGLGIIQDARERGWRID